MSLSAFNFVCIYICICICILYLTIYIYILYVFYTYICYIYIYVYICKTDFLYTMCVLYAYTMNMKNNCVQKENGMKL